MVMPIASGFGNWFTSFERDCFVHTDA